MTAETGLTSRQKLDLVQRIGALGLNAQTLIVNDKRSGSDVETLLRALQAFKENRLGGIIFSERTFNLASLAACSIEVVSLPFEKEDQKWMRLRGVRYVGEIYYVHFDAKSSYSVARGKRVLSFLEGRFDSRRQTDVGKDNFGVVGRHFVHGMPSRINAACSCNIAPGLCIQSLGNELQPSLYPTKRSVSHQCSILL